MAAGKKGTAGKTSATKTARKASGGFTAEEREAMRERARELKAASRGQVEDADGEVLARIETMPEPDRGMGRRLHEIIRANAAELTPRLWYGMPAYARNGKVLCFYQNAQKFKVRYSTLGFSDVATLDDGNIWPTSFALKQLGPAEEAQIIQLLKKALG